MLAILGDAPQLAVIMEWIRRRGLVVNIVSTAAEGLRAHGETSADLVLIGLPLPDARSAELIAGLRRQDPRAIIVVVGTDADIRSQLQALELGAHEYILDPIDGRKDLLFALGISLGVRKGDTQLRVLRTAEAATAEWKAIVAGCHDMKLAMGKLRQICERTTARSVPTVLLTGEIGTGKRLVARAIHYNGGRRNRAFVEVTCAVPSQVLHSQLFGHERDALPDARATRQGLLELVNGGTIFLDEVGAIPIELQADLLSAIEDKQIRRFGGTQPIHVDVQIIASTRRDLATMVKRGELRADLYHRLNVVTAELPPLRERGDDIIAIAEALITGLAAECGIAPPPLSEDARVALKTFRWPGNIRELRNELERIVLFGSDDVITAESFRRTTGNAVVAVDASRPSLAVAVTGERCPLEEIERELIRQALVRCGNVSKTARYLDLTRQTLLYRMKKYGFVSPSNPGFFDEKDV
ncbi:MAG: sigma-54-dependent Fis family transcriptional regulator [Myxococcales bacterium]|nr:sigma-54-dependent Fis family transcriptional regulator [Myxococcales bacterium]